MRLSGLNRDMFKPFRSHRRLLISKSHGIVPGFPEDLLLCFSPHRQSLNDPQKAYEHTFATHSFPGLAAQNLGDAPEQFKSRHV